MEHTPPKNNNYHNDVPPRHKQPLQRPDYTYHGDAQRQTRRPSGGRIVFDYEKEEARRSRPEQKPEQNSGRLTEANYVSPHQTAAGIKQNRPESRTVHREEPHWRAKPEQEAPLRPRAQMYDQNADHSFAAGTPAQGKKPVRENTEKSKKRFGFKKKKNRLQAGNKSRSRQLQKRILIGSLITMLLIAGILLSAAVLFKIETITVVSAGDPLLYEPNQIEAVFGHPAGENLFAFRSKETCRNIEQALPYLENVKIRRRLPDEVIITAQPASEAYTVESAAGWVVLSRNFKVLRLDAAPSESLMRVDGAQADAPVPGQQVAFTEPDKLKVLENILKTSEQTGLFPIYEVDLSDMLEISLLYQNRIRIVLGTEHDMDYKIGWAWRMVTPGETKDSLGEEERGTLDVSTRGSDGLGRARWRAGIL